MARKYDFISELYNRTCKTVVANPASWEAFLRSACYNYRLRFDEQLLVHAQRRTPPPFFRSTTGTKSLGDGSIVGRTALPFLRMPTNAASGLSTTSIFPTRIPAAFPAEFPFGKCGTNTRQK